MASPPQAGEMPRSGISEGTRYVRRHCGPTLPHPQTPPPALVRGWTSPRECLPFHPCRLGAKSAFYAFYVTRRQGKRPFGAKTLPPRQTERTDWRFSVKAANKMPSTTLLKNHANGNILVSQKNPRVNPTTPMIIPTLAISLVSTRPVDAAMAFGGVEMGNSMAREAHIAMKEIMA